MILLLIAISLYLGFNLKFDFIQFLILSFLFLIYIWKKFSKRSVCACFLFIIGACIITYIEIPNNYLEKEGVVIESKENYFLFQSKFEKYYVYEKDNNREIGDFLSIKGSKKELSFSMIESSFDFKSYLNKKGVYYELDNYKIKINFKTPIRIKKIKNNFLSNFSDETKDFLSTLLFSSGYDGDEIKTMKFLQINRLISISGIYLYAIMNFIEYLLHFFLKEKHSKIISLTIVFILQILTFPKLSILRFLIMRIISFINKFYLDCKFKFPFITGLSMIILMLIDYHFVYQDAFIIGFALPLLLYYSRPVIKRLRWWKIPIATTILIYIFFIPISLKYNYSINLLSLPMQIIITPLLIPFFIISFLSFFKIPLYFVVDSYFLLIKNVLSFSKNFSLIIYGPNFSSIGIFIFYFSLIAVLYYLSCGFKPLYKTFSYIALFVLSLNFIPIKSYIISSVSFINVGQGDACLIQKGPTSILIDTGGSIYKDIANECLIPYFKKNKIYDIDLVITTHNDFDHNGALPELINNFNVDEVVTSKNSFPLTINGIHINNLNDETYEDDNDNSLVLNFTMWDKKFLIMGDASIKVEKEIMNKYKDVDCDFLKIGHHGSNTSTSENFIKKVTPEEAIISVGQNYYGHPHESVLEILRRNNVKIRRTDLEGTITYWNYIFM